MRKACANCRAGLIEVQDGKETPRRRCGHVAFYGSGFIKNTYPEDPSEPPRSEEKGLFAKGVGSTRGRARTDRIEEMRLNGFVYRDVGSLNHDRKCDHWRSHLARARETLTLYGDAIENYPWIEPLVRKWFEDRFPMEERTAGPLDKAHPIKEHRWLDVPDEYLKYEPCWTCAHYRPEIDAHGVVQYQRGECALHDAGGGIFEAEEGGRRTTYAFMSCGSWSPDPEQAISDTAELRDLPPRFLIYSDVYPVDLPFEVERSILGNPLLRRTTEIDPYLESLTSEDLIRMLQDRHHGVDVARLAKDLDLSEVTQYFAKMLKRESDEDSEYWRQFDYGDFEEEMFGGGGFREASEGES